jgi:CheY-like chemotaxis protein
VSCWRLPSAKKANGVEVAHSVEAASAAESQIFDIIISDVRMPGERVDLLTRSRKLLPAHFSSDDCASCLGH